MKFLNWIKKVFTGSIEGKLNAEKVFSSVAKGIDELGLTNEEKAEGLRQFVKETLSENSERSKARRHIAKVFLYFYLLLVAASMVLLVVDIELVKSIIEVAKAYSIGWAFLAIIGFYFGGYYLAGSSKNLKGKKKE